MRENDEFQNAWFLPNKHLQTIIPAILPISWPIKYIRKRLNTPDNDFIDVDWVYSTNTLIDKKDSPLLVLFHGLEGSSKSHYAQALCFEANQIGWNIAVINFRSCSGELNKKSRFYHAGDYDEIDWILRYLVTQTNKKLFVVGVSLGGNALLCWLGMHSKHQLNNKNTSTNKKEDASQIIRAAVAISSPIDLFECGKHLEQGFNRLYSSFFLYKLKKKCIQKLKHEPNLFSKKELLRVKTIKQFDDLITAPLHGFKNVDDYWSQASPRKLLTIIDSPTLLLNAINDPIVPISALPSKEEVSSTVLLDRPANGGHVGFLGRSNLKFFEKDKMLWMPKRVCEFLKKYL